MPDIYLRHPIHGEKVEHNPAIAQMDKGNGWVEFDPNERPVQEVVEPVVPPVVVPEPPAVLPFLLAPPVAVPDAPPEVPSVVVPEPPSLADLVKPAAKPKKKPEG